MNLLIADPDRDFLTAFRRLLEYYSHKVKTVFDGTQVITKLAAERFDIVILNEGIPRVSSKEIIKLLNEDDIPVIEISEKKINSGILSENVLANSYITLPFLPDELTRLIDSISKKRNSDDKPEYMDVNIDLHSFMLCNKLRVTNEELDIFISLMNNEGIDANRAGPYINALNLKFEKLRKKSRIKYVINEGYRLVMNNNE